jgi:hypothetical protein
LKGPDYGSATWVQCGRVVSSMWFADVGEAVATSYFWQA